MKYLLFLVCIPMLCLSQANDCCQIEDSKGIFLLKESFLANPTIELKNDTLLFEMTQDSVIVIKSVKQENPSYIWIHYADMGFNDFWESYCRAKYNQGWAARREHDQYPKKFIQEYFHDKEIELLETIIYYSSIKARFFSMCGVCYGGTDFLFKINKIDYQKLCDATGIKMLILKNNFR